MERLRRAVESSAAAAVESTAANIAHMLPSYLSSDAFEWYMSRRSVIAAGHAAVWVAVRQSPC